MNKCIISKYTYKTGGKLISNTKTVGTSPVTYCIVKCHHSSATIGIKLAAAKEENCLFSSSINLPASPCFEEISNMFKVCTAVLPPHVHQNTV